jgi:hypothetical protein
VASLDGMGRLDPVQWAGSGGKVGQAKGKAGRIAVCGRWKCV